MRFRGFGEGLVGFYEELAAHNTREWWQANKRRYEDEVRAPFEHLLDDLSGEFGEAKVFRPHRDTRFSRDKSPYKTAAAAMIGSPLTTGPTLYLQVSATGLMTGAGIYHMASDQLSRLREAIAAADTGAEVELLAADVRGRGGEVGAHDELKTAPRGYPKDHPRIALLRLKGLIGWFEHAPGAWLHRAKARDRVADDWRALAPLNGWLAAHVGPSTLPPPSRSR